MRRAYVFRGMVYRGDEMWGANLAVIEANSVTEAKKKFEELGLKTTPFDAINVRRVQGDANINGAKTIMENDIKDWYDFIGSLNVELEVLQFNRKRLKETGNF